MTELTDLEILMKHDVDARPRARMELKIVNRLIADAAAAGYTLRVEEYEEDDDLKADYDVKSAIFDLDDSHILVFNTEGERVGWIFLVMGNDGYDVISDYCMSLEVFLKGCGELADRLENGLE